MTLDTSTRLVHSGQGRETGSPSTPPIHTGSIRLSAGDADELDYSYGREGNPTWEVLEQALGELEDARALVFASGQAATFALIMALTEERSRLCLPSDGYFGARLLAGMLQRCGIESVALDLADLAKVERALDVHPSVLWAESPTNPFLRVLDLEKLGRLAAQTHTPMVVDNTTATAALQRPLDLGATAVMTSLTKSSSGHADVLLGAVTTRDEGLAERVLEWRTRAGSIAGPFEAWLTLRGLRTLPLRIACQSRNAAAIAAFLTEHARVRRVHYPGLDPATRALAKRQMPGGGGPLLSFELDGDSNAAVRVVRASHLVRPASSFGGLQSSWERRARWPGETAPESLIRFSAGIEAEADLIADVESALEAP